ncbi:MAG: hypothetical protein QOJ25_3000 [Solirubrobacteraceae bacterium]|nr:hypothetical protein [Solirubrobacteraceae bacterium]
MTLRIASLSVARKSGRVGPALALALAVVAAVAGVATAAPVTTVTAPCSSTSQAPQPLTVNVPGTGGQQATGIYSLPATAPKGIVVVGHGFPGTATTFAAQVQQIATNDHVIALSMNYRGTDLSTGLGWRVIEGAHDSIAATKLFDGACPGNTSFVNTVVGISMGGNMSGIAVSSNATRADGATALYDYWFDVSGVTNVPEIYADGLAISTVPLGSVQALGQNAVNAMNAEFGGTPVTALGAYLSNSPVFRAGAMRASGLKGVEIFHGIDDGEVTADQSAQMATALGVTGIPTDVYTSLFNTPGGSNGLTLDGDTLGAVLDVLNQDALMGMLPAYVSPFSGHVSAVVLSTALAHLNALYTTGQAPTGLSVTLADGDLGTYPLLSVANPLSLLPNVLATLPGVLAGL